MFLPLSRLKILRSTVRKKKTGPRSGSTCIYLTGTTPHIHFGAFHTFSPVLLSIVRALFISYGNEKKIRAEVKEFVNVLPCFEAGENLKGDVDAFLNSFPIFSKTFNDLALMTIFTKQAVFSRMAIRSDYENTKLIIEEKDMDYHEKVSKLPICIAVNTINSTESLPLFIQAKLAIKLLHTTNFEDTIRAVRNNPFSSELSDILTDMNSYHEFLNSLKKGEELYIPWLRMLQNMCLNYKRSVFLGHARRIEALLIQRSNKGMFLSEARGLYEDFPNEFTESVFKVGHENAKSFIDEHRKRVNKVISVSWHNRSIPKLCWDALATHQELKEKLI